MIVCLDSGNSRIKWGVREAGVWLAQGALAHAEADRLAGLLKVWPVPEKVMLANVAGVEAAQRIRMQLAAWAPQFCEVRSEVFRAGVTNHYENPASLGVDRWCALIGAHSLNPQACIVVMAGTATTIDTLDDRGNFLGGLILPGLEMMRRSLSQETAALPMADGLRVDYPRCTIDAISSGVLEAQAGAIERAFARLSVPEKSCLLSGGNADLLASALVIPHAVVENLPMEGLGVLALME